MTEADYIVVSALTRVRAAQELLRPLVPSDALPISRDELRKVHRLLEGWAEKLGAAIDKRMDDEGEP